MTKPEQRAREIMDAKLAEAGWVIQDRDEMNLAVGRAVADRQALAKGTRKGRATRP